MGGREREREREKHNMSNKHLEIIWPRRIKTIVLLILMFNSSQL